MNFKEGNPEIPKEAHQEAERMERLGKMEAVYGQMRELQVVPVKLIQGGQVIDLILEDTGADYARPFMVFEVAHPDQEIQTLIYKVRTEEDPRESAKNEIAFLDKLAPRLMGRYARII